MALFATLAMRKMQLTQKQNENQYKQLQICQKLQDLAYMGTALQDGVISPDEIGNLGGTDFATVMAGSLTMMHNAAVRAKGNWSIFERGLAWQQSMNPNAFANINVNDYLQNAWLGMIQQGIEQEHRALEAKIKAEETKLQKEKTKIEIEGKAIDAELQSIDQGIDKGAKALAPKL